MSLRRTKQQLASCTDASSSGALKLQLRLARIQSRKAYVKLGLPLSTIRTLMKLRVIADTRAVIELKLKELETFAIGSTGRILGMKPETPCVLSDVASEIRAAMKRLGERPLGSVLCHMCDEPRCTVTEHFFWGTPIDNMRDCLLKGRHGKSQFKGVSGDEFVRLRREQLLAKLEILSGRLRRLL